jgi:hypothetical protein
LPSDSAKEPSPQSSSVKPEKIDDQKFKKKIKSVNQLKAGQNSEKPIKLSAVAIVPSELNLTTSDWGKTLVVEIKNTRAEVTLYSVWIKLKANTPGLRIDDVDILSETGQEFISESFSGITANYDLVMFRVLDSDKQPCKYLLIYRLKGLESKFFKIKRKASGEAEKKPLTLLLGVSGFSEKAAPLATKDDAAALQIAPPEAMTIEAISVIMKKNQ